MTIRDLLIAVRDAAAVVALWCAIMVLLITLTGCASPNPYYWEPLPPPEPQWELVPGIHYVR